MIVTTRPPDLPFMVPKYGRLPGVAPIEARDWIAAPQDLHDQLQYRDDLFGTHPRTVLGVLPEGFDPASELRDMLLAHLANHPDWSVEPSFVQRPDGIKVETNTSDPMLAVGRLVSEDFCILAKPEGLPEYVLVAAALCFPSGWTLAEKMGRPLTDIHSPVPYYDGNLAKRVNRIFDGIKSDQILLSFNWSTPTSPELHARG